MPSPFKWPSTKEQTEWAIRLVAGDEAIWAEIHSGLALPIATIICRRYYRILPEDLAAEAIEVLWAKRGLYDADRGTLRSFLFTLTRNVAIDMIRAIGAELPVGGEFLDNLGQPLPPGEPSAEVCRLAKLLDSLSERDREIVMGSARADGDEYATELAKRYNISRDYIRVIAQRVRERLRVLLENT